MNISNPCAVMIKSLEDACNLTEYAKTLKFLDVNIATDENYQKNYTRYYRVRRDADWLKKYYEYFEKNKTNKNISFEQILRSLSDFPHKVKESSVTPTGLATTIEASFASKMLATINPDYPIWDSQVVRAMGIKFDDSLRGEDKIQAYIKAYNDLTQEINSFIHTAEGIACIELFDKTFPRYTSFSPFKKIDFFLWNIGK